VVRQGINAVRVKPELDLMVDLPQRLLVGVVETVLGRTIIHGTEAALRQAGLEAVTVEALAAQRPPSLLALPLAEMEVTQHRAGQGNLPLEQAAPDLQDLLVHRRPDLITQEAVQQVPLILQQSSPIQRDNLGTVQEVQIQLTAPRLARLLLFLTNPGTVQEVQPQ
jgi:hypothetical protein